MSNFFLSIWQWLVSLIRFPPQDAICGNPEHDYAMFRMTELRAWPGECRMLKIHCDFRGLKGYTSYFRPISQARFKQLTQQVCQNVSSVSGLKVVLTDNSYEANILLRCSNLGYTRGGPLGDCEYPSDCSKIVKMRLNTNHYHTEESYRDIVAHEFGHALGITHTGYTKDIMYKDLIQGRRINGKFGPYYSEPEMVKRYGPPSA